MKSCSSTASTSSETSKKDEISEDKTSGICSLCCLASCLNSASNLFMPESVENTEIVHLLSSNGGTEPFLQRSIFSNIPCTIKFYTKGHKVKKPSIKSSGHLTWCHNSLLPVVMRQCLATSHFKIVDESKLWIGYWGRHLKSAQYKTIKPYQKVNHFPGAFHMGRKDRLWQHLFEQMNRRDDSKFSIMPYTYILPKDAKRLKAYLSFPSVRHVILKPPASARGTGITIVSRFNHIPAKTPLVAQHYIESPLIINNSKFDLRVYVYVTSLDPLRIYVYEDGLVRFASVPYSSALSSYSNQYMHLTNYSINKSAQENGTADQPVQKWTLTEFWAYLTRQGYDAESLKSDIQHLAIKAVIACESYIREHQNVHSKYPFVSHELFGMDVLVDSSLRPWLIEMNISPSLQSSTPVDVRVKAPLARDVLNMCGLQFPFSKEGFDNSANYLVKSYTRHKSEEHLEKEAENVAHFLETKTIHDEILTEFTDADVRCLVEFEDELARSGGFELVYPLGESTEHYLYDMRSPIYSNLLLTEWQKYQQNDRRSGIEVLERFCSDGFHIAAHSEGEENDDESEKQDFVGKERSIRERTVSGSATVNRKQRVARNTDNTDDNSPASKALHADDLAVTLDDECDSSGVEVVGAEEDLSSVAGNSGENEEATVENDEGRE